MHIEHMAARNGAEILDNDLKARKLEQLRTILQDIKLRANAINSWHDTIDVTKEARVIRQLAVDGIEVCSRG